MTAGTIYYGTNADGQRHAARDRSENPRDFHRSERCEHAVWDADAERIVWRAHEEGGLMEPFLGPDAAWSELTKDGVEFWRDGWSVNFPKP